jgi:hypothetical protein
MRVHAGDCCPWIMRGFWCAHVSVHAWSAGASRSASLQRDATPRLSRPTRAIGAFLTERLQAHASP